MWCSTRISPPTPAFSPSAPFPPVGRALLPRSAAPHPSIAPSLASPMPAPPHSPAAAGIRQLPANYGAGNGEEHTGFHLRHERWRSSEQEERDVGLVCGRIRVDGKKR